MASKRAAWWAGGWLGSEPLATLALEDPISLLRLWAMGCFGSPTPGWG